MPNSIEVDNISKMYRLGLVGSQTLKSDLMDLLNRLLGKKNAISISQNTLAQQESDWVWALRNVSFEVKQGEVLGIIGKNGAGKSTLLKILSKITAPTEGQIKIRGRMASLLEVGTGFHGELTGRENIFLNGAILGMSKAEVRSKLDEIVEFAGIAKYLDTPVKRYSSGMYVRLGFAVAAHLEPEILVVDEVLAVGDYEFQKKAIGKMQDVAKGGRTVLFVSHSMGAVGSFCTKALVMRQGQIHFQGNVKEAIALYLQEQNQQTFSANRNKELFVENITIQDENSNPISVFEYKQPFVTKVKIGVNRWERGIYLSFRIKDDKRIVFTEQYLLDELAAQNIQEFEMKIWTRGRFLRAGNYQVFVALYIPNVRVIEEHDEITNFTVFDTDSGYEQHTHLDNGCVFANCEWEVKI